MAEVAQLEAGLISERTKAALARSTKALGGYRGGPVPDSQLSVASRQRKADAFAERVAPLAGDLRAKGLSFDAIAAELTSQSVLTPRGGGWTATAVRRVLARTA